MWSVQVASRGVLENFTDNGLPDRQADRQFGDEVAFQSLGG